MTRTILLTSLALAMALPAGAQSGAGISGQASQDQQAWQSERDKFANVPGYERPKKMQQNVDYYNEKYQALLPSETLVRAHPVPSVEYKGMTVASAVDASYREINKFRAGIAAFEAEVKTMSARAHTAKGDAPNRFLVGQGWKIVKAMGGAFNNDLVPGANSLYEASTKGNQNIEILIEIAGGNKLFNAALPNATKLAGTENELQLIQEVQSEHDAAAGERQQAAGPLNAARAAVPGIYDMIVEYDKAYAEYARGMSHLTSQGARLAESTLHGLSQAVTTAQAADAALQKADRSEQEAINAVRACTEGNIQALQNPSNQGAQTNASNLNQVALQKVTQADQARQAANAILERPEMPGAVAAGGTIKGARVHYYASDKAKVGAATRSARGGSASLAPDRQPDSTDQRP